MELVLSSPFGPEQEMFNAVPSSPQHSREQMVQFRYAERNLAAGSFFLPVLAR